MPSRIKVLIVDDSLLACRILSETVSQDPALEVSGTAVSGPIALAKLTQGLPDIVMLDVEMPGMDGLQVLGEIKKAYPKLPVIMCSGLTKLGNRVTMQALMGGASDYITKPEGNMKVTGDGHAFSRELSQKIKALCAPHSPPWTPVVMDPAPAPHPGAADPDILAIGISTGGPNALAEFIPRLPADFPAPIVIVQHMPPLFTKSLAESLSKKSLIEVREGVAGARLERGTIWIAPGGFHMEALRRKGQVEIAISEGPPVNSCRPSVDILFQSVAEAYGPKVLAAVLTGMGADGLTGCSRIRKAGGRVFVQDEASSVVWGMPGAVAKAGLANKVLPLNDMAAEIISCFYNREKNQPAPDFRTRKSD